MSLLQWRLSILCTCAPPKEVPTMMAVDRKCTRAACRPVACMMPCGRSEAYAVAFRSCLLLASALSLSACAAADASDAAGMWRLHLQRTTAPTWAKLRRPLAQGGGVGGYPARQ